MRIFSFLMLFLSMLSFGCNNIRPSTSNSFEVSGKISKVKAHHAYLEELGFDAPNPEILDSTSIKPDGSFKLKAISKGESLYRITIDEHYQVIFVNDNNEIVINIDPADDRHPDIQGSPASSSLYKFLNEFVAKDSSIAATKVIIDSLNNREVPIKKQDSVIIRLEEKVKNALADINNNVKNFVQSTNSPAAAAYIIVQGTKTMQTNELLDLAESAVKKFPENRSLAALTSLMKVNSADSPGSEQNTKYPLLGQQAPELIMSDVNGKQISISQFKGKYLLVDFWASWCGPCRNENPNVVAAYNKFKGKNFTILGVSLDKEKESWLKAIKDDHLNWNQMSDLKFWDSESVSKYQFNSIPFNVLIDPSGKIIASNLRDKELDKKLTEVLK